MSKDLCKTDGSRLELSNEYLVAKLDFDTAENVPAVKTGLGVWRDIGFEGCRVLQRVLDDTDGGS